MPSSLTEKRTRRPRRSTAIWTTPPPGEYLTAWSITFPSTWRSFSGSVATGPIHLAAFFGHAAAVELLADRGADLQTVSRHAQIAVTPLHSAVAREGAEDALTAEALLEHGTPPNATAEGGGTPLHSAAANGNVEIVGSSLHTAQIRSRAGRTARGRSITREGGHEDVPRMLG